MKKKIIWVLVILFFWQQISAMGSELSDLTDHVHANSIVDNIIFTIENRTLEFDINCINGFEDEIKERIKRKLIERHSKELEAKLHHQKLAYISIGKFKNIVSIEFSPKDDRLLIAFKNGIVKIFNLYGQLILLFVTEQEGLISATFNNDGKYILTTTESGYVEIWNAYRSRHCKIEHKRRKKLLHKNYFSYEQQNPSYFVSGSKEKNAPITTFIKTSSTYEIILNCPKYDLCNGILNCKYEHFWDLNGNEVDNIFLHEQSYLRKTVVSKNNNFKNYETIFNLDRIYAVVKKGDDVRLYNLSLTCNLSDLTLNQIIFLYLAKIKTKNKNKFCIIS